MKVTAPPKVYGIRISNESCQIHRIFYTIKIYTEYSCMATLLSTRPTMYRWQLLRPLERKLSRQQDAKKDITKSPTYHALCPAPTQRLFFRYKFPCRLRFDRAECQNRGISLLLFGFGPGRPCDSRSSGKCSLGGVKGGGM